MNDQERFVRMKTVAKIIDELKMFCIEDIINHGVPNLVEGGDEIDDNEMYIKKTLHLVFELLRLNSRREFTTEHINFPKQTDEQVYVDGVLVTYNSSNDLSGLKRVYIDGIILARGWLDDARLKGDPVVIAMYERLLEDSIAKYRELKDAA